jgi:glycosyltransferase involved in cell wall biosynthesis
MRVLALCSYPAAAAATRFRVEQFVGPLAERGIRLNVSPFLDGGGFDRLYARGGVPLAAASVVPFIRRLGGVFTARRYDALFVQREAMFFGPELFERLYAAAGGLPIVLDLDDATYVPYTSPSFGRLARALKFFGKTDRLIDRAAVVTCGNRFIAEYVERRGGRAVVIPTVADTDIFKPIDPSNPVPVIGWIGTHSTYPSLEQIFPVLQTLAREHRFHLRIVGSGLESGSIEGVDAEWLPWSLEREVADFQQLDIGLYPIVTSPSANDEWLRGKSGFKAVQYMAVGVPFVMSPVGVCSEMGEAGRTHLNAETAEDWYNSLSLLLEDSDLRQRMGAAGREYALEYYTVGEQADKLAGVFESLTTD